MHAEEESLRSLQPLHLLAGMESPGALQLIQEHLGRGADPNRRDEDGLTAVHVAAAWGRFESLKLLLCNGGDPLIRDQQGLSALDMAVEELHGACVRLILWWCALDAQSAGQVVSNHLRPLLEILLDDGPAVEQWTSQGSSPVTSPVLDLNAFDRLSIGTSKQANVTRNGSLRKTADRIANAGRSLRRTLTMREKMLTDNINTQILAKCNALSNKELRRNLISEGISVGPITATTRRTYVLKLASELSDQKRNVGLKFSVELEQLISGTLPTSSWKRDLEELTESFSKPGRKWRQGSSKESFCYFLLDPNISKNLPARHSSMPESEALRIFCSSIFYVGKGKRQRPLQHLIDAAKQRQTGTARSQKLQRICTLWDQRCGVISFHLWHSIIPAEAYTREAAVIEALNVKNLTNERRGEFYGPASIWPPERRCGVGALLLHNAMHIFLLEGERRFHAEDVL